MPEIDPKKIAIMVGFAGVMAIGYAILVRKEKPRLAENIALVFAGGASLIGLTMNISSLNKTS